VGTREWLGIDPDVPKHLLWQNPLLVDDKYSLETERVGDRKLLI
jgi:hypothetical protein